MKKIVLLILCIAFAIPALTQPVAEKVMESVWLDFRTKYPNPYQSIGCASFRDHSQLYIISEPGPHISLEDIREIFAGFDYEIVVKKWKIGYDGWVKDILIILNFVPEFYKYELIEELNYLLYSTSQRPVWVELPVEQEREVFVKENNLNYKITVSDLNQWFINDSELFINDVDGSDLTISDIMQQAESGVFYSKEPNFVLWCLPRQKEVGNIKEEFRIFTVDTDLILGAFCNASMLVVVGRERRTLPAVLPPLRTEIIETLLSTKNKYLYQSLNIGDLLPGKMKNGLDWVPASISEELENTELGHLMTLVDIILKDFLRKGEMVYKDYRYMKPPYYPEDKKEFESITTIRYNWNTDGFIKTKDFGDYRIYAPDNTGALNISLFDSSSPNDEIKLSEELERIANHYFANLNNSDVVRVVQYIFLYQLFKLNDISYSYRKSPAKDKSDLLVDDARFVLNKIKNMTDNDLAGFSGDVAKFIYYQYTKPRIIKKRWEKWEAEYEDLTQQYAEKDAMDVEEYKQTMEYEQKYKKARQDMSQYMEEWFKEEDKTLIADVEKDLPTLSDILELQNEIKSINPTEFDKLCQVISFPNGAYYREDSLIFIKANNINMKARKVQQYYEFLGIDLETVKNNYVKNLQNDSCRWIKTPKIVVTSNTFRNYDTIYATNKYNILCGPTGGHRIGISETSVKQVEASEKPRTIEQVFNNNSPNAGLAKNNKSDKVQVQNNRRGLASLEAFKYPEKMTQYGSPVDKRKLMERRNMGAVQATIRWGEDGVRSISKGSVEDAYGNMQQGGESMSQIIKEIYIPKDESNRIKNILMSQKIEQEKEAHRKKAIGGNKENFEKNFSEIESSFRKRIGTARDKKEHDQLTGKYAEFDRLRTKINGYNNKVNTGDTERILITQSKQAKAVQEFTKTIKELGVDCSDCERDAQEMIKQADDIMREREQAYEKSKKESTNL